MTRQLPTSIWTTIAASLGWLPRVYAQPTAVAPAPTPTTAPPVPTPLITAVLEVLLPAAIGGILGGWLVIEILKRIRPRPQRRCVQCRCVRLPLTPPTVFGEPDLVVNVDTGISTIVEVSCRYACTCGTAPNQRSIIHWLPLATIPSLPAPGVCPERIIIEVCVTNGVPEPPRIRIDTP